MPSRVVGGKDPQGTPSPLGVEERGRRANGALPGNNPSLQTTTKAKVMIDGYPVLLNRINECSTKDVRGILLELEIETTKEKQESLVESIQRCCDDATEKAQEVVKTLSDGAEGTAKDVEMWRRVIEDWERASNLPVFIVPQLPSARPATEYYGRTGSLQEAKEYICSVINGERPRDYKFPMLGISGIKGFGKSEFLRQVANYLLREISRETSKTVHPMLLNFSNREGEEQKNILLECYSGACRAMSVVFARVLNAVCKVNWPFPSLESGKPESLLRQTINLIRSACKADVLVLLVDEIGAFGEWANECMGALMSCCDAMNGQLVCLFSSVDQTVLLKQQSCLGGGRRVIPLPLCSLPINLWKEANICSAVDPQNLVKHAQEEERLAHLLVSLSGHPKALFEGFQEALEKFPMLLEMMKTPAANSSHHFASARNTILSVCELSPEDDLVSKVLPKWLVRSESNADTQLLINAGVLHQVAISDCIFTQPLAFLFPLPFQAWSQAHASKLSLAYHLSEMYECDASLLSAVEGGGEVMMHFEAALRLAIGDKETFPLEEYYQVKPKIFSLWARRFKLKIPSRQTSNIVELTFQSESPVLESLNDGKTIKLAEKGVVGEYLTPFFDTTGKLVVACVQCKFVKDTTAQRGNKLSMIMEEVVKHFKERNIEYFPVYFTAAVDQEEGTNEGTSGDGVSMLAKDIFRFTHRVGILRMHCRQLGKALTTQYPFLADD